MRSMNKFVFTLCVFGILTILNRAQAQVRDDKILQVSILAPLYLDSSFSPSVSDAGIPKYMVPGLEFIQGAKIALDTIMTNGSRLQVHIYDTKAEKQNVTWLIKYGSLGKSDLIIGSVREPEFSELSNFATLHQIPFVSVTYPNDGGIRNNPFTIIMNSTLKTNVDAIYSFLVQKHGMDQILLLHPKGENTVQDYFQAANQETKSLLKFRSLALDSINSAQLGLLIDTTKPAVIVGASLNQDFANNIADACAAYKKYGKLTLIGMPNWEEFRGLYQKNKYADFPILFTTPHTDDVKNKYAEFLDNRYFSQYRAKPSELAYKGFESVYYFVNLLLHYQSDLMENLNHNEFAPFHDFNFRPVDLDKNAFTDYFENKHITIVQILNGRVVE